MPFGIGGILGGERYQKIVLLVFRRLHFVGDYLRLEFYGNLYNPERRITTNGGPMKMKRDAEFWITVVYVIAFIVAMVYPRQKTYAQTATVVELSATDAKTAKELWAAKQKADDAWKAEKNLIEIRYMIKDGRFKAGFDETNGQFEFSKDFRYVVPKTFGQSMYWVYPNGDSWGGGIQVPSCQQGSGITTSLPCGCSQAALKFSASDSTDNTVVVSQ